MRSHALVAVDLIRWCAPTSARSYSHLLLLHPRPVQILPPIPTWAIGRAEPMVGLHYMRLWAVGSIRGDRPRSYSIEARPFARAAYSETAHLLHCVEMLSGFKVDLPGLPDRSLHSAHWSSASDVIQGYVHGSLTWPARARLSGERQLSDLRRGNSITIKQVFAVCCLRWKSSSLWRRRQCPRASTRQCSIHTRYE